MRLIFTLCRPTRLTRQRSAINGRLPTAPFICIREPSSSSSLSSSRYLSCLFPLRTRPLMHALRAISGRCSLSTGDTRGTRFAFPGINERPRGSEREEGREGGGDAGEGGAIRATAAAAAATSALAAATAASRCKESCARERAMAKSRGQTCYERKKDLDGKERGTAGGTETYLGRAKERRHGLAQKRANVDKIGGGSLQLLAGMSGNAWDSILKARPRQSLLLLSRPIPSPTSTRLHREAPTLYRMTPGKRRDYLPIVLRSCYDHIAYLIHETHVIY